MEDKPKKCSKCREAKSKESFGRVAREPTGRNPICRECVNGRKRAWREANKEKLNDQLRVRRRQRPGSRKAEQLAYRLANREKILIYQAVYREANCERLKESHAAWRFENKEKVRFWAAAWHRSTKDERKRVHADWWRKNREAYRQKKQLRVKRVTDVYIKQLLVGRSRVLKSADIPESLVEAKREQLMLNRLLKEK